MTLCMWSIFNTIIPSVHSGAVGQWSPGSNSPSGGSFKTFPNAASAIYFRTVVVYLFFLLFDFCCNTCKQHRLAVTSPWHIHYTRIQGLTEDPRVQTRYRQIKIESLCRLNTCTADMKPLTSFILEAECSLSTNTEFKEDAVTELGCIKYSL